MEERRGRTVGSVKSSAGEELPLVAIPPTRRGSSEVQPERGCSEEEVQHINSWYEISATRWLSPPTYRSTYGFCTSAHARCRRLLQGFAAGLRSHKMDLVKKNIENSSFIGLALRLNLGEKTLWLHLSSRLSQCHCQLTVTAEKRPWLRATMHFASRRRAMDKIQGYSVVLLT